DIAVSFAPDGAPPGTPLEPAPNVHGAPRYSCRLCGECIVGCQYGSKNTLDYTYLSAAQQAGATIRCCCEATLIAPRDGGGWRLRGNRDASIGAVLSEALGPARESAAMLPLLGMGRDIPGGRMTLHDDSLRLSWDERESRAFFEGMEAGGRAMCRALGGRMWRP